MLRVVRRRVQLLNMRPGHALAAGDAVLKVDVFLVGFQRNGVHLAGVALGNRREQAVFKLVTAGLEIGRLSEERERQLHIGMKRVITLLFLDAVNNHGGSASFIACF